MEKKVDNKILPDAVIPRKYMVFFKPSDDKTYFSGSVVINVDIIKNTNSFKLHSNGLVILKASMRVQGPVPKPALVRTLHDDILMFEFSSGLKVGWGVLTIHFSGSNSDGLLTSYEQNENQNEANYYIMSTNFHPSKARNCFPCWDLPSYKTPFEIIVNVPLNETVFSNMPIESEEVFEDNKNIKLVTTTQMATHSVAIVAGPFRPLLPPVTFGKTEISIVADSGDPGHASFALQVTSKLLQVYESYLNVEYPLPKLDIVAVPEVREVTSGWGIIMGSKSHLFFDPQLLNYVQINNILQSLAYAVGEQILGHYVSPERWSDMWVVDGALCFLKTRALNICFPKFKFPSQFLITERDVAFEFDCLSDSHCLDDRKEPIEVDNRCRAVVRYKSSSVFEMLHHFMGKQKFRDGLQYFVETHKNYTVNIPHIWQALEYRSNLRIEEVLQCWINQKGYPLVTVVNSSFDASERTLLLKQEKFSYNNEDKEPGLWWIPLTFTRQKYPAKIVTKAVMFTKTMKVTIQDVSEHEWIKVNTNSIGFYRVYYPTNMINPLMNDLVEGKLPIEDQIGLLSDYMAFAKAGMEKTSTLLSLIVQLGDTSDYLLWKKIIEFLYELDIIIRFTNATEGFKEFVLTVMKSIYHNLSWYPKKNEDILNALLRPLVLEFYSKFEEKSSLSVTYKTFKAILANRQNIHGDLRRTFYYVYTSQGGSKDLQKLIHVYTHESNQVEQEHIAMSLHGFRDEHIIEESVKFVTGAHIRKKDVLPFMTNLLKSNHGSKVVWEYIKSDYIHLEENYSEVYPEEFNYLIEETISGYPSEKRLDDVEEFVARFTPRSTPACFKRGIEKLKIRIAWALRDKEDIEDYFGPWAVA